MSAKDTNQNSYQEVLSRAGLSESEAFVYSLLLKNGQTSIARLKEITPKLSRTNLYNVLNSLTAKSLVIKLEDKKKLEFKPSDPYQLKVYLNDQERELGQAQGMLDSVIPSLSELYKTTTEKSVVRSYEGKKGIKAVMDDSLLAKTEILTYLDPKEVDEYINEANRSYVKNRYAANIKKKMLAADNEFNRERYKDKADQLTEIRFMPKELMTAETVMQIYDNKVSYMTIKPESAIGLIIDDQYIANMQRSLFGINWEVASR
jgi:sugar-specific transcriptional regulator TrmB